MNTMSLKHYEAGRDQERSLWLKNENKNFLKGNNMLPKSLMGLILWGFFSWNCELFFAQTISDFNTIKKPISIIMKKWDVFSHACDLEHTHVLVQLYSGSNYVCLKEITNFWENIKVYAPEWTLWTKSQWAGTIYFT